MIILDPTAISDATFTRASTGTYFDAAGVLQTAAADVLRVTYDPADLTAPPRALVEAAATNAIRNNSMQGAVAGTPGTMPTNWSATAAASSLSRQIVGTGAENGIDYIDIRYSGTASATANISIAFELSNIISASPSQVLANSAYVRVSAGALPGNFYATVHEFDATPTFIRSNDVDKTSALVAGTLVRPQQSVTLGESTVYVRPLVWFGFTNGQVVDFTLRIGMPQLEFGTVATSVIRTTTAAVTRAADIIGATGTVLGSNVAEADAPAYSTGTVYAAADQVMSSHLIYESKLGARATVTMTIAAPCVVTWAGHGLAADTPISFTTTGALPTGLVAGTAYYVLAPTTDAFNLSATPGGAAITTTGTQSGVHTATAGLNLNKAVSDTVYWLLIGATNQRKMLDAYNNTQTTNADAIILTMTPRQISQGLYLGNLDANEVSVVMWDATEGIIYSETQSLIVSDSASSFFSWFFKRIRRKTYFFTAALPVYANAIVTIAIKKPGGTAKCGMCALGPLIDVGLSEYGLATEIKDYSSSTFNFDGTSSTVVRGYAKRMSVDLVLDNAMIDSVQEQLAEFRQKPVAWLGATMYGSAIAFGKYSSFKNVIAGPSHSKMALQIEGTV